jgi:hypothetical protein
MTLPQLLAAHDWTYEYTEAHGTWKRGHDQRQAILAAIRTPLEMAQALAYAPKVPEPKRAEYITDVERAFHRNQGGPQ